MSAGQYKNIGRIEPGSPNQQVAGFEDENANVLEITVSKCIPGCVESKNSSESVSTTSTALVAANTDRIFVELMNEGPNVCYIGHSTATTSMRRLVPGAIFRDAVTTLAWNGICAATESATIHVYEIDKPNG